MPASNMDIARELQEALIQQKVRAEQAEAGLNYAIGLIAELQDQNATLQNQNISLKSIIGRLSEYEGAQQFINAELDGDGNE